MAMLHLYGSLLMSNLPEKTWVLLHRFCTAKFSGFKNILQILTNGAVNCAAGCRQGYLMRFLNLALWVC